MTHAVTRARRAGLPALFRGFVLVAALSMPLPASAQVENDFQIWAQVVGTVMLEDWRVHLELQPRFSQDAAELDHTIVRWAVGRQLTPKVSVWAGHAWISRTLGPGTRHEQRLWQQLSVTLPEAKQWTPSLRFRVEQRFLESWADNSHRLRAMVRGVRPIAGPWSLAVWDEFLVNVDETPGGGPPHGYDQNRAFAGVLRRLSQNASLEGGYLLQTVESSTGSILNAHAAFTWLNLTF